MEKKLTYKLSEVADLLSVSYSTIYRMVERGDIKTIKVSTVRRVPLAEVERIAGIKES